MNKVVKSLARLVLGDYAFYRIYSRRGIADASAFVAAEAAPVTLEDIDASPDPLIRDQRIYHKPGTFAFGWWLEGRLVAVCYFWHGEQYRCRNFWPLAAGEAKLVQIVTVPDARSRGVATALIAYASAQMYRNGFRTLYARIWHSNRPSLRAFARAGWAREATVIVVHPLRLPMPLRMVWPATPRHRPPPYPSEEPVPGRLE